MTCSTCKFSALVDSQLLCKRYPPTRDTSNNCVPPKFYFPTVVATDGCGEFDARTMSVVQAPRTNEAETFYIPPPAEPKRGFFSRLTSWTP
jgi:hypothetical protein